MGSTSRRDRAPVSTRLLQEPYRFDFFQAVRLLERMAREAGSAARQPVGCEAAPRQEAVRFRALPSLSFPPSAVYELRLPLHQGGEAVGVAAGEPDGGQVLHRVEPGVEDHGHREDERGRRVEVAKGHPAALQVADGVDRRIGLGEQAGVVQEDVVVELVAAAEPGRAHAHQAEQALRKKVFAAVAGQLGPLVS